VHVAIENFVTFFRHRDSPKREPNAGRRIMSS
jgi:hypothetical protein